MGIKHFGAACAACSLFAGFGIANSQEHPYSEGPVVNVASIRTVDGKTEDYLVWLATTWKAQQEAAKKAGHIIDYEVLYVEPRGPNDPDIYLVTRFKNWAALDGSIAKNDEIAKQIEGSITKANQAQFERAKIREVLGSQTMQVLTLK